MTRKFEREICRQFFNFSLSSHWRRKSYKQFRQLMFYCFVSVAGFSSLVGLSAFRSGLVSSKKVKIHINSIGRNLQGRHFQCQPLAVYTMHRPDNTLKRVLLFIFIASHSSSFVWDWGVIMAKVFISFIYQEEYIFEIFVEFRKYF